MLFPTQEKDKLTDIQKFMEAYRTSFMGKEYLKFDWAANNDFRTESNNLELFKLSSGEQTFLNFFGRIWDVYTNKLSSISNSILLIDEGELTLHPQWQKEFTYNLVQLLNHLPNIKNKTIQVILTSHSPLILSDFPSDNVIFLEKDKETGFCKVVSGTQKQTFGANIHTLLADSFFLQDGTIGTFAMRKIEELIDEIKAIQELTTQKELKEIEAKIKLIGEPLLKRKIHTYFKKQSEIPQQRISLDQQIALTQERLKKLQEERAKHPNLKNRNQDKGRGNDQSQNL